jgi:hypothetical protein
MPSPIAESSRRATAAPNRWFARVAKWATLAFAFACFLIDVQLVRAAGADGDALTLLFRAVLLEIEAYLVVATILMTFAVIPRWTR